MPLIIEHKFYKRNDFPQSLSVVVCPHVLDRDKLESLRLYFRHDRFNDLRGFRAVTVTVVQDDDRACNGRL